MQKFCTTLILLGLFVHTPAVQAQVFFNQIDSQTDAYTGSRNSYEIRQLTYTQVGDRIRFILDTDVPLQGHSERGALDGHVGHTDLRISTPYSVYGVKFAPNENYQHIGVYQNPKISSVVRENFGRDGAGLPTLLTGGELVTDDILVFEYPNAGINNSHRIVIELPVSEVSLLDGASIHATFECGNDIVVLDIPAIEFPEIDIPVSVELPPISEPDFPTPEEDDEDNGLFWKLAIPATLLILILVLLDGNTSSVKMDTPIKIITDTITVEEDNEKQSVPEKTTNAIVFIFTLITLLLLNKKEVI